MNSQELTQYKKQLQEQLASLRETANSHERQLGESHTTNDFIGGDRAAELETLEVDSSVVDSEENLARKIEHALERIAEGKYGICEVCEAEIPAARLEAKPSVSLCIDCTP
jgi:DnaK suppressor protein